MAIVAVALLRYKTSSSSHGNTTEKPGQHLGESKFSNQIDSKFTAVSSQRQRSLRSQRRAALLSSPFLSSPARLCAALGAVRHVAPRGAELQDDARRARRHADGPLGPYTPALLL